MSGKTIAILGGGAVVAYALFADQIQFALTGKAADAPPQTPTTQPQQPAPQTPAATTPAAPAPPAPSAPPTVTSEAAMLAAIAAAAASDSYFSSATGQLVGEFGRWNFYFNRTPYGAAHPITFGAEQVGLQRGVNDTITLAQWWALAKPRIAPSGLSGIARRRAWGE